MNSKISKSNFFKKVTILASILFAAFNSHGQATTIVSSTIGYDVNITLDVVKIIAPNACPNGYNYNTRISYDVSFTGTNIPSTLYTLQISLKCGAQGNFVGLPLRGGSGFKNTTSNPWQSASDCKTATPESLNCDSFLIEIEGPGISYRSFTIYRAAPLPVSILSFTAENNKSKVVLNWETTSEINNSHYIIERSIDGNIWVALSEVAATKEISAVNAYNYVDHKAVEGMSFYRLTQVDLNGKSTIIDRIAVVKHVEAITFSVYPNPASTEFSLEGEEIANAEIVVLDAMGKSFNVNSNIEGNKITFSTEGLSNGIYFVNVLLNDELKTFKVSVSK